jgi:L-rhamnose isomerase
MFREVSKESVEAAYRDARDRYAALGVDVDKALERLATIPVSINCWQGDDVTGFEGAEGITGGGIMATGNYGGKPRTPDELRQDFEMADDLIPGKHRFNMHAIYLEHGGTKVDRDQIGPEQFQGWIDWARDRGLALDFNPTFFSHPKADDGWTLASKDKGKRDFWIEHGKRCREISEEMGRQLGTTCMDNFWMPDGAKDEPVDRLGHRRLLADSLDAIFADKKDPKHTLDAVESKLFGLGSEAYVVGSHDFYVAYAMSRNLVLTMDAGHYHPTESIAEKIPALLPFMDRLMLHVSRPVRWDSDHVVRMDDPTLAITKEIARADAFERVFLAVDFFDASINRIAAWVVGVRATIKSALWALLEPTAMLREEEEQGRLGNRLALLEELSNMPFGAVWDKYCLDNGVPVGPAWMNRIDEYEKTVLQKRT